MEGGTRSLLDSLLDTAANLSQIPDVNVLRAQAREVAGQCTHLPVTLFSKQLTESLYDRTRIKAHSYRECCRISRP